MQNFFKLIVSQCATVEIQVVNSSIEPHFPLVSPVSFQVQNTHETQWQYCSYYSLYNTESFNNLWAS